VDGGEADISGAGCVPSETLETLKEAADERRIQVSEHEGRWWLAEVLLGEGQQQPEAVPVCGDRVGTGLPVS
jgi:hypothetical protein